MMIGIIALISTVIWITLIYELVKSSKDQNGRKIFLLTSTGTILTMVLSISLIQRLFET